MIKYKYFGYFHLYKHNQCDCNGIDALILVSLGFNMLTYGPVIGMGYKHACNIIEIILVAL